jgi:hypothetical protein
VAEQPEQPDTRGVRITWAAARDVVLFVAGLAGVAHQTLIASAPSTELLIVFASMMGLPAFLRKDEHRSGKADS